MTNSRPYLLDSSLLIALATPSHALHVRVNQWMTRLQPIIATCPITQGALLRVAMKAGGLSFSESQVVLDSIIQQKNHQFVADSVPYSRVGGTGLFGHKQVTDAYLAQLARDLDFKLATLDRAQAALNADISEWVG